MMLLQPSQGIKKESSVSVSSIVKNNESHRDGKLIREYDSKNVHTIVHTTPNTAVNCFLTATSATHHAISAMNDTQDDRVVTPDKLKAKISEFFISLFLAINLYRISNNLFSPEV